MDKYFIRPNGHIVKYNPKNHNLESFKARFTPCDKNGKEIKKKAKKK